MQDTGKDAVARVTAGVLLVFATTLTAGDLSGRWTLTLDPDFSGNPETLDCSFKQDGSKLTVDCGSGPPFSGEVNDRNVTLQFKTGENGQSTAKLTGAL